MKQYTCLKKKVTILDGKGKRRSEDDGGIYPILGKTNRKNLLKKYFVLPNFGSH